MSLASIARDVLVCILEGVDAKSLISLFLIGNRVLNTKISAGKSVMQLRIDMGYYNNDMEAEVLKYMFPKLERLSQITLLAYNPAISDLYIDFSRSTVIFDGISSIQHLPLRRLGLKMAKALHLFDRLSTSLDSVFPALEELILKDTRPNNIIKDEKLDWEKIAQQLPPKLSKLELGILTQVLPSNFRALLPSSITSLVLETATYLENKVDRYSELLTDLTVQTCQSFFQDDFGDIPTSLTNLHIARPPHVCYPSNTYFRANAFLPTLHQGLKTLKCDLSLNTGSFGDLPKSLTVLEMRSCYWNLDDLSDLPQGLLVFKSEMDLSGDQIALLPPTLKILHGNFQVVAPWSKFPQSLTELKTHQLSALRLPTGDFPPHLTTLVWPFNILDLNTFHKSKVSSIFCTTETKYTVAKSTLPTSITSMRISKIPSSKGLSILPPLLQTLHIDVGSNFSPEILRHIPMTMREFHIGKGCPALPFSLLRLLPHPLKHFYVHSIALDDSVLEILPLDTPIEFISIEFLLYKASIFLVSSHTHLCCSRWSVPGFKDVSFFKYLQKVKGLKTLDWTLSQSHNPTLRREYGETGDNDIMDSIFLGCAEVPFEGLTKLVCNLPPHIKKSDLPQNVQTGPLENLPVNLTDLESDLPIESILISNLVHLARLSLKNYLPSLNFLKELPHSLSSLRLDKASLAKEDWVTLPRTLTSLAIGSFALGRNLNEVPHYEQLPPLMTELTFCNATEERLEGPCTAWLRPLTFTTIGSKIPFSFDQWTTTNVSRVGTMPETIQKIQLFQLPHTILNDIFSRLPTSITLISFPNNYNFTTSSISYWPASLTSIQLGGLIFSKSDVYTLYGPDIETAERTNAIDVHQREHLDWNLLKALILAKGPANLSQIEVKNRGEFNSTEWIDVLPSNLKSVDLESSQISDSDISRLPRSLEVLRLNSCRRITQRGLSMLPDHLNELALANVQFNELNLPASLTKLELLFCSSLTAKHIENLPSCMLHLLIPAAAFTDETLMKLPEKLVSLRLRQIVISAFFLQSVSTITLPNIIDCILSGLPSTLQKLDLNEFIFDPETVLSALPPNVTHVMLPGTNNQITRSSIFSKELGIVYQRQINAMNNPLLCVSSTQQASRIQSGPSLAPKSGKPILAPKADKWLEFELVVSPAYSKLFANFTLEIPSKSDENSVCVVWVLPSDVASPCKQFPEKLALFHCGHLPNWGVTTISKLPPNLTSLEIPQSLHFNEMTTRNRWNVFRASQRLDYWLDTSKFPPTLTHVKTAFGTFNGSRTSDLSQ